MEKLSVDSSELNQLFEELGVDAPAFSPQKEKSSIEAPFIGGASGFYQLPLRETSSKEKRNEAVPIFRRVKNEELNEELIGIAVKVLNTGYSMYAEVPFKHNGVDYTARVEPHYRKPGTGNGKPEGWHKGVSLFVRDTKPWIVGTFTKTPFKRPVDGPGAPPRSHLGEDIVVPIGTRVYPIGPGVVVDTGSSGKAGNAIYILHEGGKVMSAYKHLSKMNASTGDQVGFNSVIGLSGDSGNAKGSPHLHYEVRVARAGKEGSKNRMDYAHVNPKEYIGKAIGETSQKTAFIQDLNEVLEKYAFSNFSLDTFE